MKTIHKYQLGNSTQKILMPQGAKMLTVALQGGIPCLWAEVHDENKQVPRKIIWTGTGFPFPQLEMETVKYIGSVIEDDFVSHYYDGYEQ